MYSSKLWVNKDKRRYYKVLVHTDLLGDLVLIRHWGALDTARGGMKTDIVNNKDVTCLLDRIIKNRKAKGYTLVQE